MSAHSGGGHKKMQFIQSQGSYGTRISRRGYGDGGEPMDTDDFLELFHQRRILKENYKKLSAEFKGCTAKRRGELKLVLGRMMRDLEKMAALYNASDFAEEKEILEGSKSFADVFYKLAKRHLEPDVLDMLIRQSKKHWELIE